MDKPLLDEVMQGVDYIFHLAALISAPESMQRPDETVELNVRGLLNVLEAGRKHGVKKLCFAAVYGENPIQPKVESITPDPRSPYAITKLDGEDYSSLYAREGWLQTACIRFFNVFGPRQDQRSAYAATVPIFLHRALSEEPITVYGDGGQTRDFIFVKDIVGALAFAAETPHATGVFNAGYGKSITILELVQEILQLTGSKSEIRFEPVRAGDIRHSTSDPSKLMAAAWKPRFDVPAGLRACQEVK
jgi:UDP-glucose 4-epimerase